MADPAPSDAPDRASRHHAISLTIHAAWAREGYDQYAHLLAASAEGDGMVLRTWIHAEHDGLREGRSLGAWMAATDLHELWRAQRIAA